MKGRMSKDDGQFVFGMDVSPWWFLQKVESKDVEYVFSGGRVTGCRFYDVYGQEQSIAIGDVVKLSQLYNEQPREMQVQVPKYRHYSTEQIEGGNYDE